MIQPGYKQLIREFGKKFRTVSRIQPVQTGEEVIAHLLSTGVPCSHKNIRVIAGQKLEPLAIFTAPTDVGQLC